MVQVAKGWDQCVRVATALPCPWLSLSGGQVTATWCLKMFLSTFLCKQSPNVFFGQP